MLDKSEKEPSTKAFPQGRPISTSKGMQVQGTVSDGLGTLDLGSLGKVPIKTNAQGTLSITALATPTTKDTYLLPGNDKLSTISHTLFSPCGLHTAVEMLARAKELGLKAIAITDHGKAVGGRLNSAFLYYLPFSFFDWLLELNRLGVSQSLFSKF